MQSGLATVFLFISVLGKGTTVQKAYLIMLDTMLLVYFIPYIYLFTAYIKFTSLEPSPSARGLKPKLTGAAGLGLTLLAMIVAMVPPSDTPSVALFEIKVAGGAAVIVAMGGVLYWRAGQRGRGAVTPS